GPFNQIMQECLGDGEIARLRPDVVVVAPRFEEMGAAGRGWRADLLAVADAALDAAARWGGCLVFVLPALPETGQCGVSEAGLTSGVVAEATRAREALRARLGGRPDVCVADAEQAVRAVGNRRAHHPAMFRFAKVPYTEELFATLGEQLARLLALRF